MLSGLFRLYRWPLQSHNTWKKYDNVPIAFSEELFCRIPPNTRDIFIPSSRRTHLVVNNFFKNILCYWVYFLDTLLYIFHMAMLL